MSREQYRADVLAGAAALVDTGIQVGDRVGLLSENRVEWLMADLAILAAGGVNVPPHAPLTARQVYFQMAETEIRWLFVSNQEQLEKIRQVQGELPKLEGVVVFDSDPATPDASSWASFLQHGRQVLERRGAPS
jgi:long-chain acyl-CoA synthetase